MAIANDVATEDLALAPCRDSRAYLDTTDTDSSPDHATADQAAAMIAWAGRLIRDFMSTRPEWTSATR